jgi:hypothetical protein
MPLSAPAFYPTGIRRFTMECGRQLTLKIRGLSGTHSALSLAAKLRVETPTMNADRWSR